MQRQSATAECERNSHRHLLQNELQVAEVDPASARRAITHTPRPGAATPQCRLRFHQSHRDREYDESRPGVLRAMDSWRESRRLSREYFADNRSDLPPTRVKLSAKA